MTTVMLHSIHIAGDITDNIIAIDLYSHNQRAVVNGKINRQGYKAQNITYPAHATKFIFLVNGKGHRMVIDLDGYDCGTTGGNL